MYGYIYKTTNIINNKVYIGQHKSEVFDAYYKGSGRLFKKALNKYGFNNFICEVLEWCETAEELNSKEIYWIQQYNSTDMTIGYNISSGGTVPNLCGIHHPMHGKHLSEDTKEKIRIKQTGKKQSAETIEKRISKLRNKPLSDEHKQKISIANKGKKCGDRLTEKGRERIRESSKNRVVSDTTREKLRQAHLGKKISADTRQKMSEAHKGKIGYFKDKCRDENTKKKISETLSNKPRMDRRIVYEIDSNVFNGLDEGAKFFNITKSCMSLWIKRGKTKNGNSIQILVDNQLIKSKMEAK